jgi:hypothetical protein
LVQLRNRKPPRAGRFRNSHPRNQPGSEQNRWRRFFAAALIGGLLPWRAGLNIFCTHQYAHEDCGTGAALVPEMDLHSKSLDAAAIKGSDRP